MPRATDRNRFKKEAEARYPFTVDIEVPELGLGKGSTPCTTGADNTPVIGRNMAIPFAVLAPCRAISRGSTFWTRKKRRRSQNGGFATNFMAKT